MSRTETILTILMSDFGYKVKGNSIVADAIKGFCSSRVVGSCRGVVDAAEYLCPIVRDAEYTTRLTAAMSVK